MKRQSGLPPAMAVLAGWVVALGLATLLLSPPARDLGVLAAGMLLSGFAGIGLAMAAYRFARRLSLRSQMLITATVALLVLVANVGVSAWLMFISTHDLRLLSVLALYAVVAGFAAAHGMSGGVRHRLDELRGATERMAAGELDARVAVHGTDELARLGSSFNAMAEALELARQRQSDMERARRELFAAVSHDLRTPLAAIRAMIEALADGVVSDAETRDRYLRTTNREVEQLSLLINDLFEIATIDSGALHLRLEMLRVEDLVAAAVETFEPQASQARVRLAMDLAGNSLVEADAARLSRVIYNLLQNAIRHTPADGSVVVRTESAGNAVRVTIADTGDGIAPEDLPHVFEPFFRGDRSRTRELGGAGLGLAIARGIVEAHGGEIRFEPAESGTHVCFTLPSALAR